MMMSLSCIILGVGLFIVTQATTSGFEQFFIRTILGTNGAIQIEDKIQDTLRSIEAGGTGSGSPFHISLRGEGVKYVEGIEEPKLLLDAVREFANVSGVSVVLTDPIVVRSAHKSETARAYGITLADHLMVSDLASQIIQGNLDGVADVPSATIVGSVLAERLQLSVGDSYVIERAGDARRYRVAAIYETGVRDIDRVRIYMNMSEARSLLKRASGASFIQLNVHDRDRAPMDAAHMERVLQHSASSWQEREETWLEVFRALRISTGITVSVFTLIAGLAMFNTLAMIVMEKTKDVAILRSMGYTRDDITRIFLWQAVIVLAVGTAMGCILGAGVTYGISQVPIRIRGIFATDRFIVNSEVIHYVAAVSTAVIMVMVASLVPSRRAARLEPGDVIRGTAQ